VSKKNFIEKLIESVGGGKVKSSEDFNKEREDFNKVREILDSVNNPEQLKVAIRVINNFINLHQIRTKSKEYQYLVKMVKLNKIKYGIKRNKPTDIDESEDLSERLRRIIREETENLDWIANFVTPKSKEDYITLYNFRVDRAIEDYVKEYGEEPYDSWDVIVGDGDFTVDEVVGWYLSAYENSYEQWLENTKGVSMTDQDNEVTKILKSFSEKSEDEEIIDEDSMWGNDESWGTENSMWDNDPMWGSSDGGYDGGLGNSDDGGDFG
jgi:hypothetical protein